jgi:hypothetical protein
LKQLGTCRILESLSPTAGHYRRLGFAVCCGGETFSCTHKICEAMPRVFTSLQVICGWLKPVPDLNNVGGRERKDVVHVVVTNMS